MCIRDSITPGLETTEAAALLRYLLDWLRVDMPAITALVKTLEHTHLHACLTANDDLSLTRPAYLDDATKVAHLHRLLSSSLRPTLLRHGELLSPMEATIYHPVSYTHLRAHETPEHLVC